MLKFLLKFILSVIAFALTAYITLDVNPLDNIWLWVCVAVVMSLLNTFVKPIIKLLALPITILTLGVTLLIINALLIMLCSVIVDGFVVENFVDAIVFSIVLSIITWALNKLLDK